MFGRSLNKYTSNERKPVQIFPWVDKKVPSLHLAHKWNSFFSETSVLMCSRVILHHHAWSLVSDDLFWSLKAVLLRKQKGFTFLSHWNFSCLSHLQRSLSTNSLLLWKTNLKMTVERRQNHLRQSELIFQKTFRTLPQKWRNFQGCLFFLLWVESQNEIGRNSFRNDLC